jgi:hypothetical protein
MSLTCDKNFVRPGDIVNVSGFIDNTAGTSSITDIKLHFL